MVTRAAYEERPSSAVKAAAMASETKTFSGIDRAKIDSLRSSVSAFVQLPAGDTGDIEGQGVKGRFAYDEPAQTLTLTLDEVPFFVPRGMVWSTMSALWNLKRLELPAQEAGDVGGEPGVILNKCDVCF